MIVSNGGTVLIVKTEDVDLGVLRVTGLHQSGVLWRRVRKAVVNDQPPNPWMWIADREAIP